MKSHLTPKNGLILFFSVLAIFLFYNLRLANKVLPNVYVGDLKLSGVKANDLVQILDNKFQNTQEGTVSFELGESRREVKLKELGVSYDSQKTAMLVLSVGREGSLARNLWVRVQAPFTKVKIKPVFRVDFGKLTDSLGAYCSKIDKPAQDAQISFSRNGFEIIEEKRGEVVDRLAVYDDLKNHIEGLNTGGIQVAIVEEMPNVLISQTQGALDKVRQLSNQRVALINGYDSWSLAGENLLEILRFYPEGQASENLAQVSFGNSAILLKHLDFAGQPRANLDVTLDDQKLGDFIGRIAMVIDKRTVDATVKFENGRVVQFSPAQDGQELDRAEVVKEVASKVSTRSSDQTGVISINLPVKVTRAKIANEEINSLGIRELIGRGVSYFAGSIANRAYNVGLGTSRLSGVLVKPGDTFSFNKTVGEVSGTTGYKQAYVISAGHTVLDDGGGICQVSTTVFRAALNAGLPIVTRTAHAYRVGYYEQHGFKPGLDATVWSPAVDFQFKNDTDHYVLVQAVVDPVLAKLQVDIYGTSDGRKVLMTDPVLSNESPALPEKRQDDPTLANGTVKQVDFAAPGATTVFTRKVYKGDNLLIDDTFKAVYRPWQAVYLIGTGG